MFLTVISSSKKSKSEIETVIGLFDNGLEVLHLSKKGFSKKKIKEYLDDIPKKYHSKIILHNNYWMAVKYKLLGIHLRKSQRNSFFKTNLRLTIYRMFHPTLEVTTTFRSVQSLSKENRKFHHVLLSPVFNRIKNTEFNPNFSERQLKELNSTSPLNVVAIGGVSETQVEMARQAGFYGVALHSTIWRSKTNSVSIFKEIKAICDGSQKAIYKFEIEPKKINL